MFLGIRWRTLLGPALMPPTLTRGPNRRTYTRLSTTILLEFAGVHASEIAKPRTLVLGQVAMGRGEQGG